MARGAKQPQEKPKDKDKDKDKEKEKEKSETHVEFCKRIQSIGSTYIDRFKASTSMEQAFDGKLKKETDSIGGELKKCKSAVLAKASELALAQELEKQKNTVADIVKFLAAYATWKKASAIEVGKEGSKQKAGGSSNKSVNLSAAIETLITDGVAPVWARAASVSMELDEVFCASTSFDAVVVKL